MKKLTEFEECMHKIRYIERAGGDTDVAKVLGMPLSSFSTHKKRGDIPVEFVLRYCKERDVSIDWLLLKKVG